MIGSSMAPATLTTPAVEVWKDIEGYEGLYQVSSHGQVRSVECDTIRYRNGQPRPYHKRQQLRKQKISAKGYMRVGLHRDSVEKTYLVHRLVAQAFIPNPGNLPEINHKDQNPANNRADNLEWCTRKYNMNYGDLHERQVNAVSHPIEQLTMDGQHVAYFRSAKELERLSGGKYYERDVRRVAKSKTTRHSSVYGFRWRCVEKTDNLTYCTEPFVPKKPKSDRKLEQLTMDGRHVAYYKSATKAAKEIGCPFSCIYHATKRISRSSHGYRWRFVDK